MAAAQAPAPPAVSALESDSDRDSGRVTLDRPPRRPHDRDRRRRRERRRDDDEHRDNRPVPADIKLKTVTHLLLTDPMRQFSRWHFSLKPHLMNADPLFGNMLEGEDSEWLYHYELSLAKLLTAIVKDEDAAYVVAGATRRNKDRPGTAALAALSDAYQYDPLDHIQTLKAELHRPIQPGNTLRGLE